MINISLLNLEGLLVNYFIAVYIIKAKQYKSFEEYYNEWINTFKKHYPEVYDIFQSQIEQSLKPKLKNIYNELIPYVIKEVKTKL